MDANYFQHIPYLNSFNEEKGTHLVDAGDIHYEPFGIYPGTKKTLDEIAEGDSIAVPNDTTNLKSDEIKAFINDTYDGSVIPFE